jgi:LuxR family transcriptional regulator, maltose regulon positive regulatory protein
MKQPLNIAKIIPPRIPQILYRSRLMERLQQNRDKKLILILGQAGQGKSTLAVSYLSASDLPSAWINLSSEESDAVNLFHLLGHSLQRVLRAIDLSSLLEYPSIAMFPREELHLYREWVQSLAELLTGPVQVVFDGLDRLAADASSFRLLQVLLAETPPNLRLILLSREMPPLPIPELQERGEAFVLASKELTFTPGETKKFFVNIRRLTLTTELIKRIHQLTEGWTGGLVLLADMLDWVPESSREKYISEHLAEKFAGKIFQYYGEKIFASLPEPTQEFLIKSSILDIIEPGFIREFLGYENAREILEDLVRRNLFVESIYDKKRGWLFRYHQLFRDFLQNKFKTLMGKEQQLSAYLQAGSPAEQRGDLEQAVQYYLLGRAFPQAIAIMERIGTDLLKSGRIRDLSCWLQKLPEETVPENPWLLFFLYMTKRFTGGREYIFNLQKALALFEAREEVRGSLLALAYLIEASIFRGNLSININELLSKAEALLQSMKSGPFPYERAVLWLQTGLGHFLRSGNPRKGYRACQNAYLLAQDLGDIPLQLNALIFAHGSLSVVGEFSLARETSDRVNKLLEKITSPELRALQLIFSAQLHILEGGLLQAGELVHKAQEETEKYGLTFMHYLAHLYDLILKPHLGDFAGAEEIGQILLDVASAIGNRFLYGNGLMHLGICYYHQGNLSRAKELLGRAREVYSAVEARADYHLMIIAITMSLIRLHLQEDGGLAERELQEVINHSEDIASHILLKEAHLAMAFWKWRHGRADEAAGHLQAGFNIAAEKGYVHYLYLSKADLARACTLALELEVPGAMDYATHLLVPRLASEAESDLQRLAQHPNHKIARKVWEIRRAIHRAMLPRLTIKTFGGFRLLKGEAPMQEREWEGNQPRLLLKAIIAHRPGAVSKEVLQEDLWPESPPEVAERNFKVNLHRLRKALEPAVDKLFGSSYLHLKSNFVFLDKELCQIDLDDFLTLHQNGEQQEEAGNLKEALSCYKKAVELYQGDFLLEELYSPWAETKREDLRGKYLELLMKMSDIYEQTRASLRAIEGYKKAIQADPFLEQAYQRLMVLYANRGMRSAALKIYEDCRKALQEELNASPDAVTEAIYQKILEGPAIKLKSPPASSHAS